MRIEAVGGPVGASGPSPNRRSVAGDHNEFIVRVETARLEHPPGKIDFALERRRRIRVFVRSVFVRAVRKDEVASISQGPKSLDQIRIG